MKIYTRTGDEGTTSLFAGGRVTKDDTRLHAYGTIDELNSVLGIALAHGTTLTDELTRIQTELFTLGADLATPLEADADRIKRVEASMTTRLEQEIDAMDADLPELKHFVLPGGTLSAATLHQARTVCRRAERFMVAIREEINGEALRYTNRLADWLFIAARTENHRTGTPESKWMTE